MRRGRKPSKGPAAPAAAGDKPGARPRRDGAGRGRLEQRLAEAHEQRAALAEILAVVASSPGDVQPVFAAIVGSASRLCDAGFSAVARLDGGRLHLAALNNVSPDEAEVYHRLFPREPSRGSVMGRAVLEGRAVHVEDVLADPEYDHRIQADLLRVTGYRTFLGVPVLRAGTPIGVIGCARRAVRPFTATEIELVQAFAAQAVIAIDNARLVGELEARNRALGEALDQQTATSEVLKVISRSAFDLQPVLDGVVESATRLCGATRGHVFRYDGEYLRFAAAYGALPGFRDYLDQHPVRLGPGTVAGRAGAERRTVHVDDVREEPDYAYRELIRQQDYRTVLAVPMLRDGALLGVIAIVKSRVEPFTAKQIELVATFADQAVIAIENVRLFQALEARNRDLTESLEQQTATSEILRVISSSPTDVQPVLDAVAESAARLCESFDAAIWRRRGDRLVLGAHHGPIPMGTIGAFSLSLAGTVAGRSVLDGRTVHVADVQTEGDAFPESSDHGRRMGFRTILTIPLMREGAAIGAIALRRTEAQLFTERQVALLETFADQAAIAIENVRLFKELASRNHELTETLEQQTATGEILRVISRSPTDLQPVLDIVAESATRLCAAQDASIFRPDGDRLRLVAHCGPIPYGRVGEFTVPLVRGVLNGRAVLEGRTLHVADLQAERAEFPEGSESARQWGHRTVLSVPLMREGVAIGSITLRRTDVELFSDKQIALLGTFADQAVIAIENVRLFKELDARNRDLGETLKQQTATAEILRVISRSPTDIEPTFDAIARAATTLCEADNATVFRFDGELIHFVAQHGRTAEEIESARQAFPQAPSRRSVTARAITGAAIVQLPDVSQDPEVERSLHIFRTVLSVPLIREGSPLGAITVARRVVRPFTDQQIELLQTFAEQAVIAIENVRLFQELAASTRDLTRSVGELQALGEVSQAVGSSLDLETVLATIVSRAVELSGSHSGIVYEFDETTRSFHARATHQITPAYLDVLRAAPIRLGEGVMGRAGVLREPVAVVDIEKERELVAPQAREYLAREGLTSLLAVPLVREDRLLGGLVILRRERGIFSPEVVAILLTFAAQSVLAIHNAGLFREIQRQQQYADALVQTSPVAIATVDRDGRVVGWNPGAVRLFGYTEEEATGRQLDDLVATAETREEVQAHVRQILGGERIDVITRRRRKDGTAVDVEVSAMPLVVEGTEAGIIVIYHDITELLRARREAEAANEAKSAFLATMSHEIRTPMNAVIGMSGLLLNTALTEEQREYAEVVRQSGDALLTVINDILDFSKIEAGKLELESQPFDLRECVESALDLVATRAADKGLDLAYQIAEGTPPGIAGDVTRLRQVLLNLLSNAVKFTESGEVVLSVSARRLEEPAPLHELTFAVRDTGIGIPPDRVDRLFQSFSQVDASTTRRYGGTGLGLAISQRLTELMGGRIGVRSEVGRGSEFRFTIRAPAAEVSVPTRRDLSGVQPSLRDKHVLVVDDNATNRRILTAHLDAWGMRARATGSPREALQWIGADEPFDVAILDMHMPEMDGVTLARSIREHVSGEGLPLILFTSLGRREARADSEGFAAYLHKPIKPSQLFDALVSVLAEHPVHVGQRGAAAGGDFDPDMARRHPLRILLAEDNIVNQKVALRLLGQMGYRADVAGNGLEAIEAVERQTYDVVVMDVQMPELDGFEASREINRRWPRGQRPRLVAMTANAMQGDRELCMDAGMDDYVTKPIRVGELVAALNRCPRRAESGPRLGPAAPGGGLVAQRPGDALAEPAAPEPGEPGTAGGETGRDGPGVRPGVGDALGTVIDRTVFEALTASMGGPFVAELIDTAVADSRDLIGALRTALGQGDLDVFRRAAHSLKSNGETLGATRLAALARELEAMARAGQLQGAGPRVEQLVEACGITARALGDLRRGLSA